MRTPVISFGAALLLGGCQTKSTLYCEKNPDLCTATTDAPVASVCTGDDQCAANANGMPFCLEMTACVACRDNGDCMEPTAICESSTHACRGCKANDECDSEVCLGSGACAPSSDVAYVGGPNASGVACTKATPCPGIEDGLAVDPMRHYIRVVGAVAETQPVTIDGSRAVEILGGGSKVTFMHSGVGFDIQNSATVGIHDLEISHATSSPSASDDCIAVSGTAQLTLTHATIHACGGDAINSSSGTVTVMASNFHDCLYGIEAFGDTALVVRHSTIHHNPGYGINTSLSSGAPQTTIDNSVIAFNATSPDNGAYSGLKIRGAIAITNSIITNNGSSSSMVGGLDITETGPSSLDFVTIADNISTPRKAMICTGVMTVTNSIITGNMPSGFCVPSYSLVDALPVGGTANLVGDPAFAILTTPTDPTDPKFYRITAASAAIDHADPTSAVPQDIDGDVRPAGHADMGADEYVP